MDEDPRDLIGIHALSGLSKELIQAFHHLAISIFTDIRLSLHLLKPKRNIVIAEIWTNMCHHAPTKKALSDTKRLLHLRLASLSTFSICA